MLIFPVELTFQKLKSSASVDLHGRVPAKERDLDLRGPRDGTSASPVATVEQAAADTSITVSTQVVRQYVSYHCVKKLNNLVIMSLSVREHKNPVEF